MVRDHDAVGGRQVLESRDRDAQSQHRQGERGQAMRDAPPRVEPWHDQRKDRRDDEHQAESGHRAGSVESPERARQQAAHAGILGLRSRSLPCPPRSVTGYGYVNGGSDL